MDNLATKLYALFNPINKSFVGWSLSPQIVNSNLLIKEIRSEQPINMQSVTWIGDYDTGRMVDLVVEQKSIVTESSLTEQKYSVLFRSYPPIAILESVVQQIAALAHIHQVPLTPDMAKITELLNKLNAKFVKDVAFYSTSPDHIFVTSDQERSQAANAFATS